jgi:hypothetical protein
LRSTRPACRSCNGPANLNDDGAAFVAKLSSTGKHVWSYVFGRYFSGDYGNGVAFDRAGNVVAVGTISGTIDIGGATLPGDGQGAAYVVKYAGTNSAHLWSYSLGNRGEADAGTSVAVDSADSALVTGSFADWPGYPAMFGGVTLKSTGERDVFVAKYASAGAQFWVRRFGGPDVDIGSGIAVDSAGGPRVVGSLTKFAEFDGHPVNGNGDGRQRGELGAEPRLVRLEARAVVTRDVRAVRRSDTVPPHGTLGVSRERGRGRPRGRIHDPSGGASASRAPRSRRWRCERIARGLRQ